MESVTAPPLVVVAADRGVAIPDALAEYLRWLANKRGRSGRITSPETVRAYTSALPVAFAGIATVAELNGPGRARLHANVRRAWAHRAPATFNAKRAAVAGALDYFHQQGWAGAPATVLAGLDREHQPKPDTNRVRSREAIDEPVRPRGPTNLAAVPQTEQRPNPPPTRRHRHPPRHIDTRP